MGEIRVTEIPLNAVRITLELKTPRNRLDQVLIETVRKEGPTLAMRNMTRTQFKELFKKKRVRIKGQPATPSSSIAAGTTFIDLLGLAESKLVD